MGLCNRMLMNLFWDPLLNNYFWKLLCNIKNAIYIHNSIQIFLEGSKVCFFPPCPCEVIVMNCLFISYADERKYIIIIKKITYGDHCAQIIVQLTFSFFILPWRTSHICVKINIGPYNGCTIFHCVDGLWFFFYLALWWQICILFLGFLPLPKMLPAAFSFMYLCSYL